MIVRLGSVVLGCVLAAMVTALTQAQPQIQQPGGGGGGGGGGGQAPATSGELLKGTTLELTAQVLREAGYTEVQVYTARSGSKHVSGKVDGMVVSAIHLHCKDDRCPALAYLFNFGKQDTIDAAYMNAWNQSKLYARLYKNKEESLILEQDVLVLEVPPVYLKHTAIMYARLLRDVMQFKPASN